MNSDHEDEKFWFDDGLTEAVTEVLRSGHFPEAQDFEVKAIMAKGKHPRGKESASCSVVPEKIRVATGEVCTFLLCFWEHDWALMTPIQRLECIIHECHHMDHSDKTGNPRIRNHNEVEDFCNLAKHDKYSKELALKIPMPSILRKAPVQGVLHA